MFVLQDPFITFPGLMLAMSLLVCYTLILTLIFVFMAYSISSNTGPNKLHAVSHILKKEKSPKLGQYVQSGALISQSAVC